MEGLLILIGIWLLDVVIKKVAANRKKQQQIPPTVSRREEIEDDQDEYEAEEPPRAPRSLQDLIRQFNDAQRDASQGTYVPPDPPVERHRDPNKPITLRDVAEVVISVDIVNLEFLMDEFEVDENTAAEMLMALQAHRIVGHDMGEGDCDVLVHDMEELDNLLNREKRAEEERSETLRQAQGDNDTEREDARRQELERQRQLNELEDRAKSAREAAASTSAIPPLGMESEPEAKKAPRSFDKAVVRKGFIWAKVIDEPRFKRRWNPRFR
ncbi:MAG: hypothetical protein K6E57_08255 [Fibrobacter sp.]|nr:hypothetical protein [Fibrobacter sp.]